jgi:hypothetical protein
MKDMNHLKKTIQDMIGNASYEQIILLLLMGLGNTFKTISEKFSEREFNDLMKDPVISISASMAQKLMQEGDEVLKNYGVRK